MNWNLIFKFIEEIKCLVLGIFDSEIYRSLRNLS